MDGQYTPGPSTDPEVVVVGAASRDIATDDGRGWRLGGGVTYSALATARLGLATAALIGVDEDAASAPELRLLRAAGVDVRRVVLERGPVFENVERPGGRLQVCHSTSAPLPVAALPPEWRSAPNWILASVAGELSDAWARVPSYEATVAVSWQGLLRALAPGRRVRRVAPGPSALLARADLVGVSRDDLDRDTPLDLLCRLLRTGATLALTNGPLGGLVIDVERAAARRMRRYPAVAARTIVDPTGAGDVFLAALVAARWETRGVAPGRGSGAALLFAAAAASLVVERRGLAGVPERAAVAARIAEVAGSGRRSSGA